MVNGWTPQLWSAVATAAPLALIILAATATAAPAFSAHPADGTAPPATTADAEAEPEAAATLDALHAAASAADGTAYFKQFTPDAVFIGTDPTERWTLDAFKAYAMPYFSQGRGWTYVPARRAILIEPGGAAATFDEDLDHARYGRCRGTGALRRTDDGWRIVQYVLTIPIPNDLSADVVGLIQAGPAAANDDSDNGDNDAEGDRAGEDRGDSGGDDRDDSTNADDDDAPAPPRAASLRGISAAGPRVAWASGSGGTVLRTVDGGFTWTPRPVSIAGGADLDYRDVEGFSADVAVIMSAGFPGRILRTEDGGATWAVGWANDEPEVFLDGMAFWDASHGIAYGDPLGGAFLVLLTDDGGASWTRVPAAALPTPRPGEAGFAASGSGVAVVVAADGSRHAWIGTGGDTGSPAARVLHSTDDGRSWAAHDTPLATSASAGIFSLSFADASRGIAIGGDYLAPDATDRHAAITADGGRTWTLVDGPPGFRSSVVMLDAPLATEPAEGDAAPALAAAAAPSQLVVATGTNGTDVSRDGGRTWAPLLDRGLHALSRVPGSRGLWASGADARLVRIAPLNAGAQAVDVQPDHRAIDGVVESLYASISGPTGAPRDWPRFRNLFLPGAILRGVTPESGGARFEARSMTVSGYIEQADALMTQRGFREREVHRTADRFGRVAHVLSTYELSFESSPAPRRGVNSIQLIHDGTRWWIASIVWDSERPDAPIPPAYLPATADG